MTGLNAAKPIHMDDAVYHMYAAQIAEHPGDPYGGDVVDYWFPPKRGMDVLAPVFLPYLWSRAIVVHGDVTWLSKLWLRRSLCSWSGRHGPWDVGSRGVMSRSWPAS